jgi:hypothetical protein
VIVRILGEGQFDVSDELLAELNQHDDALVAAIDNGDQESFRRDLAALLDRVRASAQQVPDDFIGPSEFVLPPADSSLEEVRDLLGDEGLVPGR